MFRLQGLLAPEEEEHFEKEGFVMVSVCMSREGLVYECKVSAFWSQFALCPITDFGADFVHKNSHCS